MRFILLTCALFAILACVDGFVLLSNPVLNRPHRLLHRAETCPVQVSMVSHGDENNPVVSETAMSRRSLVAGLAGLAGLALPTSGTQAWADFPKVDAAEEGFVAGANGIKIKDYSEGSGQATKDGDVLRIQFALYFPDGSIVSRFAGVEAKVTLGKEPQEFPPGLEQSIKGMKVGGERGIIIPPEQGWSDKYRSIALPYLRACSASPCRLDTTPLIAQVKLVGYSKGECGEGGAPVEVDASQLSHGKILLKIGSSVCPEGNVEVTEERMKTRAMIDKLRQARKL